jgi:hypothetical protein
MFLGSNSKVYILDKAENNPAQIVGGVYGDHPAWAVEYDWQKRTCEYCCSGFIRVGSGACFGTGLIVTHLHPFSWLAKGP